MGEHQQGFRNEMQEENDNDAAAEGLCSTREERLCLTGEELKEALVREQEREDAARARDLASIHAGIVPCKTKGEEFATTTYPRGTWICKRCKSTNLPSYLECPAMMSVHNEDGSKRTGKDQQGRSGRIFKRCGGSQATTWGGYADPRDNKQPRAPEQVWSRYKGTYRGKWGRRTDKTRYLAKIAIPEDADENDIVETLKDQAGRFIRVVVAKEVREAQDRIRKDRKASTAKKYASRRAEVKADPYYWRCDYCRIEPRYHVC